MIYIYIYNIRIQPVNLSTWICDFHHTALLVYADWLASTGVLVTSDPKGDFRYRYGNHITQKLHTFIATRPVWPCLHLSGRPYTGGVLCIAWRVSNGPSEVQRHHKIPRQDEVSSDKKQAQEVWLALWDCIAGNALAMPTSVLQFATYPPCVFETLGLFGLVWGNCADLPFKTCWFYCLVPLKPITQCLQIWELVHEKKDLTP